MERRKHLRYGVRAQVDFWWRDNAVLYRGSGITRDISSNGMFIYSECLPSAKADLEIELSFPSSSQPRAGMRATGLVIRVDKTTGVEELEGFAVLNRSYTLHS